MASSRQKSIPEGKTGTCKDCDVQLVRVVGLGYRPTAVTGPWQLTNPDVPHTTTYNPATGRYDLPTEMYDIKHEYQNDHWESGEHEFTCPVTLANHKSKEFCEHRKQSYEICGKPTDRDNWMDGLFACGVHTKIENEEVTRRRYYEKEKADKEQREEIALWQATEAGRAYDWMIEHGWEMLLQEHSHRKGFVLKERPSGIHYDPRLENYRFDIMQLQTYLEKEGFDGPGQSNTGEQQDMGSDQDSASVFD